MKRRVLIVDDETSLLFAARQYLTDTGFEVECAREAEEAQALLANFEFDVVITDIRLTELQGAEGLSCSTSSATVTSACRCSCSRRTPARR